MKHFVLGTAFLMFISSLPADATNNDAIMLEPQHEPPKVAFLKSFGDTLPPIGYVNFCRERAAECRPPDRFADQVQLTAAKFAELKEVNQSVNDAVAPVTDLDLYGKVEVWTYPVKQGDCEDYVLLKRRILIERGWPESTLLITVVREETNDGHAVLTVRTDRGDLVLDNKQSEVMAWADTPYTFVKRQSTRNPLVWISLLPTNLAPQPAVSASNRS
ncbi:MAG: transglutaminase-like cysteine peptidase [Alphaproteobacteria bacterium]